MIHTDGVPTIAMRESEPLLTPGARLKHPPVALEANRDPGDESDADEASE